MPLTKLVEELTSWNKVFETVRNCASKNQLTALAFVSQKEYLSGTYIATMIEEFARSQEGVEGVINNFERMAPMLYPEAKSFTLMHGEMDIVHPMHTGPAWMMVIVYS